MLSLQDELALLPLFQRLPPAALRATASLWSLQELPVGTVLWRAGAPVEDLGILLGGDLRAVVNEVEVGRVLPGELIGEAAGFFVGSTRTVSLVAHAPSKVAVLTVNALRTLRWQRSPLYTLLLDAALSTLAKRIQSVNQKIAGGAVGREAAPVRSEPALLARLWRALVPGGPSTPCPDLAPMLRALPGLRDAEDADLVPLQKAFVAEPMVEGKQIFLEGDSASSAFLIADGAVDVLRNVRGDRAERLASLQAGDLIGINTLIQPGPRTASCVGVGSGWLYRMDASAYEALEGEARLLWRESMLASLAAQIRMSNNASRRDAGRPLPAAALATGPIDSVEDFEAMLRASGFLEGLPVSEGALADIEVVITEDQKRNPRRR